MDELKQSDDEGGGKRAGEAPAAAYTRIHFVEEQRYSGVDGASPESEDTIASYDGFNVPVPSEGDTVHLGEAIEDENGELNIHATADDDGYEVTDVDYVYVRYKEPSEDGVLVEWDIPLISVVVSVTPRSGDTEG